MGSSCRHFRGSDAGPDLLSSLCCAHDRVAGMRLPTGSTVTFLFTDIEGSTRLERAVGSATWATVVARHDRLLRAAVEKHGGIVVKTEGDAFFAAFDQPGAAAWAAVAAQRALAAEAWPPDVAIRVRMGLHIGEGRLRQGGPPGAPEDYVGIDVNYAARIAAVGNGGQIVLSDAFVAARGPGFAEGAELGDVGLADEGLRAVKDFEEPIRLYRLVVPGVADDTRPLRTLEAPSNLPGDVTDLVGREAEIDVLRDALATNRIVTLTGPGGSGKTRLALGVARAVTDRFPHGVWFVDLAALRDPGLLESAIASTLGVRESSERNVAEALRDHLRGRIALVLLDNLEQLLPQAAGVVSGLLRHAPTLRILVTSRERLRIAGERGYPVPPLGVESGVALFEDRARAQRPDLVLTGEARAAIRVICERLGGLPLAIELAAARIRLLESPTDPRATRPQPRPRGRSPRPARAAAHPAGRDRLEPRAALGRGAPALSTAGRLRRRLDPRGRPTGRRPRRRSWRRPGRRARVARGQESPPVRAWRSSRRDERRRGSLRTPPAPARIRP